MEKNEGFLFRELLFRTEGRIHIEDAYSYAHIEDASDEDFMTGAEQGFMLGYCGL